MPDSVIKKIEEFVDRDKANNGINFRNRHKEPFKQENEDCIPHLTEGKQEPLPYPDVAVELTEKELEQIESVPTIENDEENDENEEAAAAEQITSFGSCHCKMTRTKEKKRVILKVILMNQHS